MQHKRLTSKAGLFWGTLYISIEMHYYCGSHIFALSVYIGDFRGDFEVRFPLFKGCEALDYLVML